MIFDHLAVSVDAIDVAIEYYRTAFPKMEILHQDATWALIQIDSIKIAFVLEDEHPPHLAFRLSSRDELERCAASASASIQIHRDGTESFYQEDPSGNTIEMIYYPNA
jgi:catechol-2,3-dioxygenase